jgi:hypothetical protein
MICYEEVLFVSPYQIFNAHAFVRDLEFLVEHTASIFRADDSIIAYKTSINISTLQASNPQYQNLFGLGKLILILSGPL